MAAIDPLHQFQIEKIIPGPTVHLGNVAIDLSITNVTLSMLLAAGLVIAFFFVLSLNPKVVPGRLQVVGEGLFGLIGPGGQAELEGASLQPGREVAVDAVAQPALFAHFGKETIRHSATAQNSNHQTMWKAGIIRLARTRQRQTHMSLRRDLFFIDRTARSRCGLFRFNRYSAPSLEQPLH